MMIKSRIGLAVAGVVFGLFCFGAGWTVRQLLLGNREAVIARLPLVPEQAVALKTEGEFVVSVEVPRLATDYRKWEFEVVEHSTQWIHSMKWKGPRATGAVKGFSTIKVPLGRVSLTRPDTLTLRVRGLAAEADYSLYRLVLARPHLGRMALQIVGLVLCGVGMLLSLLRGLWLMGVLKAR